MIEAIKKIFGIKPSVDFESLISKGAVIIDVRSKAEYADGHLKNSISMPLNILNSYVSKLNKNSPIIICCESGMRSRTARLILNTAGFQDVYNAGSWRNLKKFER